MNPHQQLQEALLRFARAMHVSAEALDALATAMDPEYAAERIAAYEEGRVPPSREVFHFERNERTPS